MQNLKNILLGGSTRVVTVLIVPLQQIQYLLLGSPVTGNCSSGRLYAVQFQEIPGIQHVDGCFPVQVTMVRVRIGRLFKEKKYAWSTVYVFILYRKYVRVEEWICTRSDVHHCVYIFTLPHVHTFYTKWKHILYFTRTFFLWTAVQSWLWPWLLVPENSRRHVGSLGFPGTGQRRVFQKNSSPLQGIPKVSIVFVVEEQSRPWLLV